MGLIKNVSEILSCTLFDTSAMSHTTQPVTLRQSKEELEKFLTEYKFQVNPQITKEQRYELLQLLYDYKDCFARNLQEMGRFSHCFHNIEIMGNKRAFKRQYKLLPDDAKEAERQIKEMLDIGVIEPAQTAEYNSPIFLVDKRNGSKRLVVDLRAINDIAAPRLVQLPKIDELLDDMLQSKPKYWNLCDLRSGFWQVYLGKRSRPLTVLHLLKQVFGISTV